MHLLTVNCGLKIIYCCVVKGRGVEHIDARVKTLCWPRIPAAYKYKAQSNVELFNLWLLKSENLFLERKCSNSLTFSSHKGPYCLQT